ncbi:histone RNA hairpin-binding protein isoform X2 [Drosophila tropicalis]|uniref:histone RNA hairpin-binding protein isoform X2 n=1 Tax=Drosophila tropicalis TaxID=46794 RepID=UPI0035AC0F36
MLCEDQLMSVDNTPIKCSGSPNSSASSTISMETKPLTRTWAQEVRAELGHSDENSTSLNSSCASNPEQKFITDIKQEIKVERKINFEFLDDVNETPPSHDEDNSRSNSPNSSCSSSNQADEQTNGPADARTKRHHNHFKAHKEEKRLRHNSYTSSTSSSSSYVEADPAILSRRQKQIDYGKNTAAYERYLEMVPRAQRTREHPRTPNKNGKYSRRAFDGLVKIWRKSLHYYDPPSAAGKRGEDNDNSDSDSD